jgi:hypothetical protein
VQHCMAPANRLDPQAQKQALVAALNEHRINTLAELRRVERIFATLGSSDLTQPMTSACKTHLAARIKGRPLTILPGMHYVNSHSLLSELRGLTRNYPFRYVTLSQLCPR